MNIAEHLLIQRDWKFEYTFGTRRTFKRGDTWKDNGQGAWLYWYPDLGTIEISTTDEGFNQDGPNNSIKFKGRCETIEFFDLICAAINLNC